MNSGLSATRKLVGLILSLHMNDAGENCYVSVPKIGKEGSLGRTSVLDALATLHDDGWIEKVPRAVTGRLKPGHSSIEYRACWPDDEESSRPSNGPPGGPPGGQDGVRLADGHIEKNTTVLTLQKAGNVPLSVSKSDSREEELHAAQRYLDLVKANRGKQRDPNLNTWATTIRLMRQRDGLVLDEIFTTLQWALAHKFWFSNVLSPDKLRKHWSSISAQRIGPADQAVGNDQDGRCERILLDTRQRCANRPANREANRLRICEDCYDDIFGDHPHTARAAHGSAVEESRQPIDDAQ